MNLEGCTVYQRNFKEPVGIVALDRLNDKERMILIKLTNENVGYGWALINDSFEIELRRQLNKKNVKFEFNKTKFWWLEKSEFTTNKNFIKEDSYYNEFNFYIKKENGLLKNE